MAQLVALMSGVVLGGVAKVVGRISLESKYLQHLSAQLIHYIPLYIYFIGVGGIRKLDYFWGSCLNILGLFLKVKVQNLDILEGCNFTHFLGVIPDIFGGTSEPVDVSKIESTQPHLGDQFGQLGDM